MPAIPQCSVVYTQSKRLCALCISISPQQQLMLCARWAKLTAQRAQYSAAHKQPEYRGHVLF